MITNTNFSEEILLELYNRFYVEGSELCAILYNKRNILSIGHNSPERSVPIFRIRMRVPAVHAEVRCISNFIKTVKHESRSKQSCDLVVIRVSKRGLLGCSKPCKNCAEFITSLFVRHFLKIKTITYYDTNIQSRTIYNLERDHISRGWKRYYHDK